MLHFEELKDIEPVYQGTEAPRSKVVAYIKALTAQAQALPEQELLHVERIPVPPYEKGYVMVEGIGNEIANAITSATLQDWIIDENGDLSEINGIAGQLEIEPENERLWSQLFQKINNFNN